MRRVVRYLSVVVAITLMLTAESVSIATAAVPPLQPIPGVASVSPANGAVVGVAHPVVVTFTTPVTDRRAVERSIRISTPHNTTGHSSGSLAMSCGGCPTGIGHLTPVSRWVCRN